MPKLPKGVQSISEAASKRGRGGQTLRNLRTNSPNVPRTSHGIKVRRAVRKGISVTRGSGDDTTSAGIRHWKQKTRTNIDLSKKPRGTGPKKLPKGVQSIAEASTRRGRGGQALKTSRIKLKGADFTPRGKRSLKITYGKGGPTKVGKVALRMQTGQTATTTQDLRKAPKPSGLGRLGKIAKGVGKLGAIGMALGAYSMAKDFQRARKPRGQEM